MISDEIYEPNLRSCNAGKAYNGAYEDELARLQSESRGMSDEESRAFHSGERAIDDGIRSRFSGVLERRIESGSRSGGYGDASLVNEKNGKNYVSYFSSKAEVNDSMREYVIVTKENG